MMSLRILFKACPGRKWSTRGTRGQKAVTHPYANHHSRTAGHRGRRTAGLWHDSTTLCIWVNRWRARPMLSLTCQLYRPSHVRAFKASSLSGSRLSGNAVLGRSIVCAKALLPASLRAGTACGVEHVSGVDDRQRHCECGRRRESDRQARM